MENTVVQSWDSQDLREQSEARDDLALANPSSNLEGNVLGYLDYTVDGDGDVPMEWFATRPLHEAVAHLAVFGRVSAVISHLTWTDAELRTRPNHPTMALRVATGPRRERMMSVDPFDNEHYFQVMLEDCQIEPRQERVSRYAFEDVEETLFLFRELDVRPHTQIGDLLTEALANGLVWEPRSRFVDCRVQGIEVTISVPDSGSMVKHRSHAVVTLEERRMRLIRKVTEFGMVNFTMQLADWTEDLHEHNHLTLLTELLSQAPELSDFVYQGLSDTGRACIGGESLQQAIRTKKNRRVAFGKGFKDQVLANWHSVYAPM